MEFSASSLAHKKAALIIAHPGHELRVHHWLEVARPTVFILTDGSGRTGESRLGSTMKILDQAGARPGAIFGRLTDAGLYRAVLDQSLELFTGLLDELAQNLRENRIEYVVGDPIEGYNPAHDLCRTMINAAQLILKARHSLMLENFDFLLSGRPEVCPARSRNQAIFLRLNDQNFRAKFHAARNYAELDAEIESAVNNYGLEAFRTECLRPANVTVCCYDLKERPFYERHGEARVAAGFYTQVIRYREHMIPLAEALRHHAERFVL